MLKREEMPYILLYEANATARLHAAPSHTQYMRGQVVVVGIAKEDSEEQITAIQNKSQRGILPGQGQGGDACRGV
jgi:hypothetical protein